MVVRFTDEQIPFVHVGHYGEAIAAECFDVDPNIGGNLGSGHDFVTRDGQRVEVKTLKRNDGKTRNDHRQLELATPGRGEHAQARRSHLRL